MRRERRRKSEKTTPEGESKENKITRGKERTRNEKALPKREEHLRKSIKSGEGDGRDNEGRTKNEVKKNVNRQALFIHSRFLHSLRPEGASRSPMHTQTDHFGTPEQEYLERHGGTVINMPIIAGRNRHSVNQHNNV